MKRIQSYTGPPAILLLAFFFLSSADIRATQIPDSQSAAQAQEGSKEAQTPDASDEDPYRSVDYGLTTLNEMMAYTQVYNMVAYSDDYIGSTVRMAGKFAVYLGRRT